MFEVKFADIGEGIHEGVIYKFEVEEGQDIEDGDTLFLVETDKVTAEIPSPVSGRVKTLHFEAGDTIHVGETIVSIDSGEAGHSSEPLADQEKTDSHHETVTEQGSTSVVGDLEISSEVIASSEESVTEVVASKKKVLATPVARKMAKDLGVNIQEVTGTGPAGRVMKEDIRQFADRKLLKKVPQEPVDNHVHESKSADGQTLREPMTQIRKAIAEQMVKSKFTIPHTAVMDEVIVDDLVAYRNEAKLLARQKNIRLTYLPFIIKAVAISLKAFKVLNASADMDKGEIVHHESINIGIAVDTPQGLMVPVIHHADQLSILALAERIEDLSGRAQSRQLKLEELKGSTFTITNYGAFGSSFGVPVINYPEAAILGIGKIDEKPIVKDHALSIGYVLPLSMSFDHRIVDGADAGKFLNLLKELLGNPQLLMLS